MSKREPGLDLLRCMALLLVVTFHSFLYNGYYGQVQTGFAMWLAGSLRWFSVSCIGLFLMLTGYLKSGSTDFRTCCRGLVSVLLGYLLSSSVSIPIRHFVLGDRQSLAVWLRRLLGFRGVSYGWYVEMYTGLVLLIPFVNLAVKQLDDCRGLPALVCVLLAVTALPGATPLPLAPAYWRSAYPLTYYVLGAAVRRWQPEPRPWQGLLGAAAIAMLLGAATVLSTDGILTDALTWEFGDLWITLMVFLLFTALYRVRPGPVFSRVLAFGAGGCYGGYLLSHLLDAWCYRLVPGWNTPERYLLVFWFVTVPIYLVSILCGNLLRLGTGCLLPQRKKVAKCAE